MQIQGERRIVSASDLNDRLACRHLLFLNLQKALGKLDEQPTRSETSELLARKGDEHESAYLKSLRDQGREVVELGMPDRSDFDSLEAAATETLKAMKSGVDVIFQATFFDGERRGHTDFLFKVDRPSDLGDYSYEVADTKLAKSSKPYFIVQLCFYSELLQKVQGGDPPEHIHVILGNREQQTYRLSDFAAYYRKLSSTFVADLEANVPGTFPYPVQHCNICGWKDKCSRDLDEADSLSRVANIKRDQVEVLEAAGIDTVNGLANVAEGTCVEGLRDEVLDKLRRQAALQVASADGGPKYELLEPREERGFERLPETSEGDIFFDFEGDPLYGESGLEYLFGWVETDSGEEVFKHLWAKDATGERQAFEQFIGFVTERRKDFPGMHIYHYAPYEVTALKRLAATYSTCEFALDELLRAGVFVDLYKVVKESLLLGQPSYSIKNVEAYYRPNQDGRETAVADGGDSIIQFEKWLATEDEEIKGAILEYNEDDCVSTVECRDWLLERRDEASEKFKHDFQSFVKDPGSNEAENERFEANAEIREALDKGVPDDAADRDEGQQARWLTARLVDYHQREARPAWWAYFERLDYSDLDEFVDDQEAIGGLSHDPTVPTRFQAQSSVHRMTFPLQETKLGSKAYTDPDTGKGAGRIVELDLTNGWLDLARRSTREHDPLPRSLIEDGPYDTDKQRGALKRLAIDMIANGVDGQAEYPACRDLLLRHRPRIEGLREGDRLLENSADLSQLSDLAQRMNSTYLFVQGPPGAGKTFSGSQVIAELICSGKRVGVTANSHKAINNLLAGVEKVAGEKSVPLRGMKRGSGEQKFVSDLGTPMIRNASSNEDMNSDELNLVAGTAWYFCREDTPRVDYLFIDEAGQIPLADALALATAAENVVLLGDPQQLAQVSQAIHPDGSGVSVLEHLLGSEQTVSGDRGVFLDNTWRMHPDVTSFISELMYEGRLQSAPGRDLQNVESRGEVSGTGLRWLPVEHHGRSQRCPEEAEAVDTIFRQLTGGEATYTDFNGKVHQLGTEDVLIVSPYNAQVRCLTEKLPEGARVGTVDKFQGQEAQVVIFSMATSTAKDVPRNIEFLFSRNRLNVAMSRARCLAVLVASPGLLEVEARSIEQMRLINALCRFTELAVPV